MLHIMNSPMPKVVNAAIYGVIALEASGSPDGVINSFRANAKSA